MIFLYLGNFVLNRTYKIFLLNKEIEKQVKADPLYREYHCSAKPFQAIGM